MTYFLGNLDECSPTFIIFPPETTLLMSSPVIWQSSTKMSPKEGRSCGSPCQHLRIKSFFEINKNKYKKPKKRQRNRVIKK